MKQRHRTSGKESTVRSGALEERNASAGQAAGYRPSQSRARGLAAGRPVSRPERPRRDEPTTGPGGTALNAALGITH